MHYAKPVTVSSVAAHIASQEHIVGDCILPLNQHPTQKEGKWTVPVGSAS